MSEKFPATDLHRFRVGHTYKIVEHKQQSLVQLELGGEIRVNEFYGLDHTIGTPITMPVYFEVIQLSLSVVTIKFLYPLFEEFYIKAHAYTWRPFGHYKLRGCDDWINSQYGCFNIHDVYLGKYFEEVDLETETDTDAAIYVTQGAF